MSNKDLGSRLQAEFKDDAGCLWHLLKPFVKLIACPIAVVLLLIYIPIRLISIPFRLCKVLLHWITGKEPPS